MKASAFARLLSSAFLALAVALVAYGLFGLSHFARYTGEYFDERLVLFDNGIYPFMWGVVLLVIGQIARLHHRRPAMLLAAVAALVLFVWKRLTVPAVIPGQELFPDVGLLNELIVICSVVLCLALADGHIQRLRSTVFRVLQRR